MGAAVFCHPLDVLRVTMQVQTKRMSTLQTVQALHATAGVRGFYSGLTAAFLRQWTYGSCRVGIYSWLLADHKAKHGGEPGLLHKMSFGVVSGGIGSFIGTPSELALVRMGADSRLPLGERRGYNGVANCLSRIAKEEGATALWKGSMPTILRASVLSATVLGTTSELKTQLPSLTGGALRPGGAETLFLATVFASLAATFTSQPFDVVKSRIQNMPKPAPGQEPLYRGSLDCARRIIAAEGPLVLMKGYTPAFIKLAPYTSISLALTEKITQVVTGADAL
eukprot:TRINITY_DN7683_c0_g1_i1.p1 TRINITY_DN7683_c0_g1~~TRINITY_DN7683_c0_g1_i1.p1  ORF type:complete len:322 (+),score=121.42 TRINITY_DN7683_c0_g1_i1:125-967(+)